jgi:hypothetical protein
VQIVLKVILVSGLLVPSFCHAQATPVQPKCPWFSEATARGILGGPVASSIKLREHADGICEFSRQQGGTTLQIRISVDLMSDITKQFPTYLAQCPPKSSPAKAIGNEAITCSLKDKQSTERIVGRVRDQAFVVDVSSNASDDPSMTVEKMRDKANLIAEQVAGSLF